MEPWVELVAKSTSAVFPLQVRERTGHASVGGGRHCGPEAGPGRDDSVQVRPGDADRGPEGGAALPEEEPRGGGWTVKMFSF